MFHFKSVILSPSLSLKSHCLETINNNQNKREELELYLENLFLNLKGWGGSRETVILSLWVAHNYQEERRHLITKLNYVPVVTVLGLCGITEYPLLQHLRKTAKILQAMKL